MSRTSHLTIPQLEVLAQDALSSPFQEVRQSAMEQLRFLSAFDQWDFLKSLFLETSNISLLCVGVKAIHFVVKNELGPQERAEIQEYMLQYVQQNGVQIPRYLVKMILAVYATAFNLNWRLMVLSETEEGSAQGMSTLGMQTEEQLRKYLPPPLMVECMKEVVHSFAAEDIRAKVLTTLRETFTKTVLPHFFRFAEGAALELGVHALELLTLVLESVPKRTNAPLVQLTLTTDESIYVAPGMEWMPALRRVVQNCGDYVQANPNPDTDEMTSACLVLLRTASTVMVGDWGGRQVLRDDVSEFGQELLRLSHKFLQLFQVTRAVPLLRCAIALVVNCMERDEGSVCQDMELLTRTVQDWAMVALACCERWQEDEAECRQALLHFFFLVVRAVPPTREGGSSRLDHMTGDADRKQLIDNFTRRVFDAYFRGVISKCHFAEESYELRCAEALVLHSEEHLQPMAELLFCERLGLSVVLLDELKRSEEQYRACIAMRRGETVPEEMLLSLMVVSTDFIGSMSTDDIVLFLTNVVLSRIAVIITTAGLAIQCGSINAADPLVPYVLQFLQALIAPDDDVTDALLQCMSIADPSSSSGSGPDGGHVVKHKLHLGVLRALFHYARCLADSEAGAAAENTYAELIAYAITKHSECIPLISDATMLLRHVLEISMLQHLVARPERIVITLNAIVDHKVPLLQPRDMLSQAEQIAREGLIKELCRLLEVRGHILSITGSHAILQGILTSALMCLTHWGNANQCFRDLVAILDGLQSKNSVIVFLEWLVDNNQVIVAGMKDIRYASTRNTALQFLGTLGTVCEQAITTIEHIEPTMWEVASFGFNAIRYYLESAMVPRVGGEDFYFPPNCISETEMYNICSWIASACSGSWVNLGIMMFYGDEAVVETLLHAADALLSIPVEVIVSDEQRRHRVFNVVNICLDFPYPPQSLSFEVAAARVWPRLLDYLVHCMSYRFSHLVLGCIGKIVHELWPNPAQACRDDMITYRTLQSIIHEVAVALSTVEGLHESTYHLGFEVMRSCYARDCEGSEGTFETLLSFCSAYHRVRLRSILMMLRGGSTPSQSAASFLSVFGNASKQQTLAAW
ncbi:Hypothetical protein, putative [Bodo saltans]|uniref:Uncharacterized protein n=1 Tax=Bodo saltans TaxID=75058 RepID=B6DTF8_BODSA|nr:hypothetical protein [Bodo saltans]CUG88455.1 Hypothetical protein, putative [Bodo saltans]|eukprot:CUG88455.1 Hypothetical protein, putative [Bodo saltans]